MQCNAYPDLALLLGYLRREGRAYTPDKIVVMDSVDDEKERKYSYFTGEIEDIKRAGQVLTNLARGHALITGRDHITMEDVKIVVKTVLSTSKNRTSQGIHSIIGYRQGLDFQRGFG